MTVQVTKHEHAICSNNGSSTGGKRGISIDMIFVVHDAHVNAFSRANEAEEARYGMV
jgi:hypothetical protein